MTLEQLVDFIKSQKSMLCVGLDPDPGKMPEGLNPQQLYTFLSQIVEATAPYCVAFKPNLAFFESMGPDGMLQFEQLVHHIAIHHPRHLIIADAKRGDIGNTSAHYAQTFFQTFPCHAITVAPYMGHDSIQPFLEFKNHWTILLALTSNAGSADFQRIADQNGIPFYLRVMNQATEWASPEQLMFVVGATHPQELAELRRLFPQYFFLVPGVGAQGGTVQSVCKAGMNANGGLLINASRSILYASSKSDFAMAAAKVAHQMQQEMSQFL